MPEVGDAIAKAPVTFAGRTFERAAVKLPLVNAGDDLAALLGRYVKPHLKGGEMVFISEKVVAIAQGRLARGDEIRVRPMARWVAGKVRRSKHGMGHRNPLVMEMAMREVGVPRILVAAAVGGLTRLLGRSGDFYRIAGRRVAAIDGTNPVTIPPYGDYVVLMPEDPPRVARELAAVLAAEVAVVDVNDVGAEILGATPGLDREALLACVGDNPLGQGHDQTPVGIVRPQKVTRATPR